MFRNASKSLTTSSEVLVQKLKRRCLSAELIRETVAKLKEYDLLNEERYARRVFESWRSRKVYGRLHLQAELLKKQVGEAYIPVILAMLSEEEEAQRVRAAYRQIAGRRDKKYDATTEKGVAALARYFSARGFGPSMIRAGLALAKEDAMSRFQE